MSAHWAAKYVGLPYAAGARGPDRFDCWGLVWLVYREQFGIHLPEFPGIGLGISPAAECVATFGAHAQQDWQQITSPVEGCGVGMSQRKGSIHHAGVYVGGKVMHCWNGQPVVVDTLRSLQLKGFRTIVFYRHALWPS